MGVLMMEAILIAYLPHPTGQVFNFRNREYTPWKKPKKEIS